MWVIEGADGSLDGDRLTVLLKIHHAAADGVTYGDFLSQLCTAEPDPRPRPWSRLQRRPARCGWRSAGWRDS